MGLCFMKAMTYLCCGCRNDDSSDTEADYVNMAPEDSKWRKLIPRRVFITRIAYSMFLFLGFIAGFAFRDGFWGLFELIPALKIGCDVAEQSLKSSCVGIHTVYRISASLVIFYGVHLFLASRLFCVSDRVKLYIQNKWFILKIPFLLVIMIVTFFIPNIVFIVYAWIALFVSIIFIIIQVVLLVDFAFAWDESWHAKEDDDESTCNIWDVGIVVFAITFFILGIGLIVGEYIVFGSQWDCHLNRVFITLALVLGIVITIGSVIARRGILPPSVVFIFAVFMTWSALLSDPSKTCNRLHTSIGSSVWSPWSLLTIIFSVLFAAFSLVRIAVTTGSSFKNMWGSKSKEDTSSTEDEEKEKQRAEVSDLFYSHLVFVFASFYMAMILSNWDIGGGSAKKFSIEESMTALWVKNISVWLTYGVFIWALIAPKVLGRWRDFGDSDD